MINPVQLGRYFLQRYRYIELNPVRTSMVIDLTVYK